MQKEHPLDWNGKLVRFFYGNSRLVWLIIISVLFGGLFSLRSLRKEGFPSVTVNTIMVQTVYPGAGPEEVETKVTTPLESALKDLKGMKDFSSQSANSFSLITINFDDGANIDQALTDVQSKVSGSQAEFPKDAQTPKVVSIQTGGPAFALAISGGDPATLRSRAEAVASQIGALSGVKKAELASENKTVDLTVRTADLARYNIALSTLSQVLQANNLTMPVGSLSDQTFDRAITVFGSYTSLDDLRNLLVGMNGLQPVYLKDVADVAQKVNGDSQINRVGYTKNGQLASHVAESLQVTPTTDADIIATKQVILDSLQKLRDKQQLTADTDVVFLYDQAVQTQKQVDEISAATWGRTTNWYLLGGLQLLFIAMLLLVNWRAALIATISLPIAFAFTFVSLWLMGIQLNTLVLFSFILVLGLIVDPSIVMVEAIQRYRDLHLSAEDSVIEAGRRYGASLFMAVLTSLLVFIPFGVVTGYFGQIIRYLPLTVIPALVASYLIPIALLPYLSKKLFTKPIKAVAVTQVNEEEELTAAARWIMKVNRYFLDRWYRGVAFLLIALVAVGLASSLVATGKVPVVQFASPDEADMLLIQGSYQAGLSFTARDQAVASLETVLAKESGIQEYYFMQQSASGFWMYINLKPQADRDANNKSKKIVTRLEDGLKPVNGLADYVVSQVSVGPPTSSYQIQTQLASQNLEVLKKSAVDVGAYLRSLDHVTKVDDGYTGKAVPEIQITLDPVKVQRQALSSVEVATQLQAVLSTNKIGTFTNPDGTSQDIRIKTNQAVVSTDDIAKLPVINRQGRVLTVADLATVNSVEAPAAINHYNGARYIDVMARVDDQKNTLAVQQKVDEYLTDAKLKQLGVDGKLNKGDAFDISKSFTELGIALLIAILLTYVVLVLQFKSFSQPFIMIFTVPLSFVGVFPALYLVHTQFGFLELLGITILVGIVENVGIFLIDYANQLVREKGLTPHEAIIQASGVRFRPILLTKLVALGGLLPLAIESPFWRGLSLVIIAGIGVSGFLSLVMIPILYNFVMSVRIRVYGSERV